MFATDVAATQLHDYTRDTRSPKARPGGLARGLRIVWLDPKLDYGMRPEGRKSPLRRAFATTSIALIQIGRFVT